MAGSHHRGKHNHWSRTLRDQWNARPDTRCMYCNRTRSEGIALWGKQGVWDAGHIEDRNGRPLIGQYAPAHRHCNRSDGAAKGNRQREPDSGFFLGRTPP